VSPRLHHHHHHHQQQQQQQQQQQLESVSYSYQLSAVYSDDIPPSTPTCSCAAPSCYNCRSLSTLPSGMSGTQQHVSNVIRNIHQDHHKVL